MDYPSGNIDCTSYDPRRRPWYVGGLTGRKNVMIVLDISGSMKEGSPTRIRKAKQACEIIINTLSNSDTFALIAFNETARALGTGRI